MARVIVKSLQTNSGFLENAAVSFSDRLTCIIGGRGTCKSTLVESLRFAFNADPEYLTELTAKNGIITRTLGAGSVQCLVEVIGDEGDSTEEFIIERETGSDSRILYADTKTSAGNRLDGDLEVYSQGALAKIASQAGASLRLQLIDRPHRSEIEVRRREIAEHAAELRILGDQARALRSELARRILQLRDLPQIRAELGRTVDDRPTLSQTVEQEHQAYLRRRRILEALEEISGVQQRLHEQIHRALASDRELTSIRDRLVAAGAMAPRLEALFSALFDAVRAVEIATRSIAEVPVSGEIHDLKQEYAALDSAYLAIRQQEQAVTESLKREDQLRKRLAELEAIEREAEQLRIEQEAIDKRRHNLRSELASKRDDVYQLRVSETERINREFGDVVVLTMQRSTHAAVYVDRINYLLGGSRVRGQEDIARELAERFDQAELLSLIESGDAQRIANVLDRDLGQVTRVVSFLRDNPELYTLEEASVEDSLEITMFDRGEPKPVEQLSGGQRATALLPLILRDAECPLVVDQPEDDLDNSFIYEVLVRKIRELKLQRQLIFVTHNANIPVLGDADAVIVMHMASATKAAPPRVGDVDACRHQIIHLLEGGAEAFRSREKRYGILAAT